MRSASFYRTLLRVYPRAFRDEYADAMTQLFTDCVQRDGASRTWRHAVTDLARNAPAERWDAFMHATPQRRLTIGAVVAGLAAVVLLAVGGAVIALALLLLVAWQVSAALQAKGPAPRYRWSAFAAIGTGLFVTLLVVFAGPWPQAWRDAVPGEVAWSVAMLGFAAAVVLVVTGLLLAFAQWAATREQRRAT